ncbi:MAG TPA: alpha/beta hydrolase [Mycobacteriales bacterium]|jgi:pimeloyl-ACP methyl ester carboxylesterase
MTEQIRLAGAGVSLAGTRWRARGTADRGPMLLLHGGGQTRHSWRRTGEAMADLGFDVLSVDARGHGESDWAPDGDYSVGALVADLRAVIAALGAPPVLVGASMGGLTGLVAEGEHPGTVRALVLVDVVPQMDPKGVARIKAFMGAAPEGFATLEDVAEAIRRYQPHRVRPVDTASVRKNVRQGPDGRWYWHWDPAFLARGKVDSARRGRRLHEATARVRVPTLLLRGGASDVVTEAGVEELLRAIPGAQHVEVPGAAHMVAGDDNSVFLANVTAFLEELSGAA